MIKTDNFLKNALAKGFVDNVDFISSGYDIKVGDTVVSVRTKGENAVIWNHKNPKLVQVKSARLDDILHRYIVLSCVGKTSGKTKLGTFTNLTFVPQCVIQNRVIFKDSLNRSWIASKYSAKNVMDLFTNASNVCADDTMLLMNGFELYDKGYKIPVTSSFKDNESELINLNSEMDLDKYNVYPKSESINKIGTTLVGSFLASATDRANIELFECLEKELTEKKSLHSSNSSIEDYKTTGVAEKVRQAIVSSGKSKQFDDFCDKNYGNGITSESLDSVLMFDTGKIYSSLGIKEPVEHFKPIVQSMIKYSDSAFICLENSKKVKVCAQKVNCFSAMFTAVPNVEVIKNALNREGYTIQDLQSGMTVPLSSETLGAILESSMDFCPVEEKSYISQMKVSTLIGSGVGKELEKFGIKDDKHAFTNMSIVELD